MGAGDGDGNGPGPKKNEVAIPNNESPGHARDGSLGLLPKRPHAGTDPPQVSDPGNYAIAGKILLAVAGAFAGVLLALVALHLYNSTRRRRLGGGRRRLLRSLAIAGGDDEDRRDAPPSPRGLDSAVLAAIPVVVVVDAGAGNGNGGDCAVCLAELETGEKARALPRCGHRFHVECIDAWFRGNATCPLCRADVVVALDATAPSAPPEGGAAQPEVRIDVPGDAATANGVSTVAPVMGRLHSGTDLDKARRVFASTRFSSF